MSVSGSSPRTRRVTKGGSLSENRLDGFGRQSDTPNLLRDADTTLYLRKIVYDLFQKELATPSPSYAGGKDGLARPGGIAYDISDPAVAAPSWKFMLDFVCIILTLPFWLPLMGVLMLVTLLASRGPIFYRQERVGLGGRHFFMWKFRTMKLSAETGVHERHLEELIRSGSKMTKLDAHGDPRLVPFGRILRASGLDELPQIFNVLRGDMSLVGPRPCTPHEFSCYESWQRQRVNGLPGLTGHWQVNGKNKTTFNQMVEMDIFYINNMSIMLDLKIMLMTGRALVEQVSESFSRRASRIDGS